MCKKRQQVFETLKKIPKGKVVSYGDIAIQVTSSARAVGSMLHTNTDPAHYPCHRVVKKDGSLAGGYAFGGENEQYILLRKEGVVFKDRKVDMHVCQFTF